jgi:hypothetical protein
MKVQQELMRHANVQDDDERLRLTTAIDANEAGRAIRVVQQSQKLSKRKTVTPFAVLLTRTNPSMRTRTQAHILNGLIAAGIPVFEPS